MDESPGRATQRGHMSYMWLQQRLKRALQQCSRGGSLFTWMLLASVLLCLETKVQACRHHGSAQSQHHAVLQHQLQQAHSSEPLSIQYEDWSNRDITAAAALSRRRRLLEVSAAAADRPQASSSSSNSRSTHEWERPGPRCAARTITAMEQHDIVTSMSRSRLSASRLSQQQAGMMSVASVATPSSLTVGLYFHVISGDSANATVNAPVELLARQLDVMNGAYGPYDIRFALKGVTRVQSEDWATTEINTGAETAMKARLRK